MLAEDSSGVGGAVMTARSPIIANTSDGSALSGASGLGSVYPVWKWMKRPREGGVYAGISESPLILDTADPDRLSERLGALSFGLSEPLVVPGSGSWTGAETVRRLGGRDVDDDDPWLARSRLSNLL